MINNKRSGPIMHNYSARDSFDSMQNVKRAKSYTN